jgi:hypothetical protein
MKIDPSKKYRTRSGKPVTCLHRAPQEWPTPFPWRGIVEGFSLSWSDSGRECYDMLEVTNDLVEVREPMRLKMWTKDGHGPIFCPSDDGRAIGKMNQLGYTLKEFVEVMP